MQRTCVHVQIAKCNFLHMFLAHNYLHDLTHNHPSAKWLHNMLTCFFFLLSVSAGWIQVMHRRDWRLRVP